MNACWYSKIRYIFLGRSWSTGELRAFMMFWYFPGGPIHKVPDVCIKLQPGRRLRRVPNTAARGRCLRPRRRPVTRLGERDCHAGNSSPGSKRNQIPQIKYHGATLPAAAANHRPMWSVLFSVSTSCLTFDFIVFILKLSDLTVSVFRSVSLHPGVDVTRRGSRGWPRGHVPP